MNYEVNMHHMEHWIDKVDKVDIYQRQKDIGTTKVVMPPKLVLPMLVVYMLQQYSIPMIS
jgi:hypothetical protein